MYSESVFPMQNSDWCYLSKIENYHKLLTFKKAELGDVEVTDEQLNSLRLAPNMSPSLLARIKELHGSHR